MQLMISVWSLAQAFVAALVYKPCCYTLTAMCTSLCAMHDLSNSALLTQAHPMIVKHLPSLLHNLHFTLTI